MSKYEPVILHDGQEVPFLALVAVLVAPVTITTLVTMFIIGPALSLGLVGIMAVLSTYIYLSSRGTDWMLTKEALEEKRRVALDASDLP